MEHHDSLNAPACAATGRRVRTGALVASAACALAMLLVSSGSERLAAPVAAVLGYAAAVDWSERRVPRWAMRIGVVGVVVSVVAVSVRRADWTPAVRAATAALVVAVLLGWLWWVRPASIGLGDVKALALTLAGAAAFSWRAMAAVIYVTALAAAGVTMWFVFRRHENESRSDTEPRRREMTVPFIPPLCAGFILGLGAS